VLLAASLTMRPGEYSLTSRRSVRMAKSARRAQCSLRSVADRAIHGNQAASVLLNGWQLGLLNSCPLLLIIRLTHSALGSELATDGVPVVTF